LKLVKVIVGFLFLLSTVGLSDPETTAPPDKATPENPPAGTSSPSPAPSLPAVKSENQLTLQKSISIALKNATIVLKASNSVDGAGTQLLQSYGQFLPNIQAIGSYSYFTGQTYYATSVPTLVNGNNYGYNMQVTSTLNLFNGFSDYAGLRSSLENSNAAKMTLERAKQQITIDITQAFLQIILDQHLVKIAQNNFSTSEERLRLLREQTKVGVRNLADLFRQEAQTSSDESDLITAQNKLRIDEIALLRRLRLEVADRYEFLESDVDYSEPKDEYPDEMALVKTALDKRVDLKASRSIAESTSWNVAQARSTYFPRIDLSVGVYSVSRILDQSVNGINVTPPAQNSQIYQLGQNINWAAGITLTWNLFDRFETGLNVQNAAVSASNAQIDLVDRRLQVEGEIRQAWSDYHAALQRLETSRKGLVSAEKAFETVKARYEVGAASFLDLVTSQTALVQAQTARIQSQIDNILQRKSIEFYLGI
jgi:outer membrane protein